MFSSFHNVLLLLFFILNIKNITLFYFICRTSCLSILHIALSPRALVQIQLLAKEIKNIWKYLVDASQGLMDYSLH